MGSVLPPSLTVMAGFVVQVKIRWAHPGWSTAVEYGSSCGKSNDANSRTGKGFVWFKVSWQHLRGYLGERG